MTKITGFPDGKQVWFLSKTDASNAILKDDIAPFFSLLTKVDMEARMGCALSLKREENIRRFKNFVKQSVMDWEEGEISALFDILKKIRELTNKLHPNFIPVEWKFIKTSGKEEGGAPYTRSDYVVIPEPKLKVLVQPKTVDEIAEFMHLLTHETFHIYSRYHQNKRKELYKRIGFRKVNAIQLGKFLLERRITNPDGSEYNYLIQVKTKDARVIETMPLVFSKEAGYSPEKGNNFFKYVRFGLFEVEKTKKGYRVVAESNKPPKILSPKEISGFFEKVGQNTHYIIHPEEILADNVALLVLSKLPENKQIYRKRYNMDLLNSIERVLISK